MGVRIRNASSYKGDLLVDWKSELFFPKLYAFQVSRMWNQLTENELAKISNLPPIDGMFVDAIVNISIFTYEKTYIIIQFAQRKWNLFDNSAFFSGEGHYSRDSEGWKRLPNSTPFAIRIQTIELYQKCISYLSLTTKKNVEFQMQFLKTSSIGDPVFILSALTRVERISIKNVSEVFMNICLPVIFRRTKAESICFTETNLTDEYMWASKIQHYKV